MQILSQVTTTSITIYYTVYKPNKERNLGMMSDYDVCIQYTRKFEHSMIKNINNTLEKICKLRFSQIIMTLVIEIHLKNIFILHLYGKKNITRNTQYVSRKHCFIQFPSNNVLCTY